MAPKNVNIQLKPNPWWEFDFFWSQCKYELLKEAWSCNGFLTGKQKPFPCDEISKKLVKDFRNDLESKLWNGGDVNNNTHING